MKKWRFLIVGDDQIYASPNGIDWYYAGRTNDENDVAELEARFNISIDNLERVDRIRVEKIVFNL